MRGELSPPSPTPNSPVGGEIVLSNVPKRAGIKTPGTPASTELGSAKCGWLNALNICVSSRSETPSVTWKLLVRYKSDSVKCGPRTVFRPASPNWQFCGVSPPVQDPVVGSTTETKAAGLSHCLVPACVTPW